jgi:glycosyltransferase involved in cell wall biosynthesis
MQAAVPSVTVLIPAYNEEGALADTVATIERQREHVPNLEIIVINDGSTDRTSEVARSLQVTLIDHETNRGYGASLKDGMLRATSEYILIADADGTYPLEDIPRLLSDAPHYDMVVGARTGAVVHVPLLRKPGKWIITRLAEYLSARHIPDLNSGLRVFRRDVAMRFLALYPDGFSFTTTITLAMLT